MKAKERLRNPIDAFLLQALEKKNLSYSPEAGRLTLLRRATFDHNSLGQDRESEMIIVVKAGDTSLPRVA